MSSQMTEATRSRIAKRMANAVKTGTDDLGNPNLLFQTITTDLLLAIASGQIDPTEYAKQELAARGLNADGRWVGFDRAAEIWEVK